MIKLTNSFLKLGQLSSLTSNLSYLSRNNFANLKVKIDYCKGCESKEMFELVEKELYNQYRRTFGDHSIVIEGTKSYEYDGRFVVDLKIDENDNERIWDNRRVGDIHEENVHKLTQIVEEKLQNLKLKTNK